MSKNKPKLIVIRGCPAVGKGTLAKELANGLKGKVAKLTLDDFQWEMTATNKRTKKDFEVSFKNFLLVLKNYLRNGYNVITEDAWMRYYGYPDESTNINKVIGIGKEYNTEVIQVLLKAKWTTIRSRNKSRPRTMKQKELKDVYDKIYSRKIKGEHVVEVDGKYKEQLTDEVLSLIK